MEENPFSDLKISSLEYLQQLEGRTKCTKCGKSRKYYCYLCGLPTERTKDKIPRIKLPVKIDIIRHPVEENGKNTAVHAVVLAPDDVTLYTYPNFPEYEDKSKVILVFPSKESMTLSELAGSLQKDEVTSPDCDRNLTDQVESKKESESGIGTSSTVTVIERKESGDIDESVVKEHEVSDSDIEPPAAKILKMEASSCSGDGTKLGVPKSDIHAPFDRVVFVDATWHYVNRIGKDERLLGVKHIELRSETTKFWRYQRHKPSTYLSTIEAIYYFLREYHELFITKGYAGDYDDLLFLFMIMYQKIREETRGGECLKAYKAEDTW